MNKRVLVWMLGWLAATAAQASNDVPAVETLDRNLAGAEPVLIQAGTNQVLLGVTDDNYAIYQEGQKLYASALLPGARRREIATVPTGNLAQVLQVGNVLVAWINPQRNLPGFGVSPLVAWSAFTGPRRISESSAVGLVAVDVNVKNTQILYPTNTTADGTVGDLAVIDLFSNRPAEILLKGIKLGFPLGPCRPVAAFVGAAGRNAPTAEYCAGTDTTATLSRWVRGRKIDLIKNIAVPLPFTLETNPQQTEFFVRLADAESSVVVVTDEGKPRVVDKVAGTTGFLTDRGTAVYSAQSSPIAPIELRLAERGAGPITVATPFGFAYASAYNFAGFARRPTPSPDGRLVLFSTAFSATTGLGDMQLLDLHRRRVIPIDSQQQSLGALDVFTTDSNYALYFSNFNLNVGTGALFAANRAGIANQLSADNSVVLNLAATGSWVSFNDQPVLNGAPVGSFSLTRADLHVVDAARPGSAPRLIAPQANLFYFASHRRSGLAYTTDSAATPGLYFARARP